MDENDKLKEFEEILQRYQKEIFGYCFKKMSFNKSWAEEVVDDVFLNLFEKWESLTIGDEIRGYLYRTADILIKKKLRCESRYYNRNVPIDESSIRSPEDEQFEFDTYTEANLPSLHAEDFFETDYMQEFKNTLSPEDKVIYELRFEKQLTLVQVSESSRIPYSTVRLRLFKIEKKVRKKIKDLFI